MPPPGATLRPRAPGVVVLEKTVPGDRKALVDALLADPEARLSDDPMPVPPNGGDVLLAVDRHGADDVPSWIVARIYKRPMRPVSPVLEVRLRNGEADGACSLKATLYVDAAWPGDPDDDATTLVDPDLGVMLGAMIFKSVAEAFEPVARWWRVRRYKPQLLAWLSRSMAGL